MTITYRLADGRVYQFGNVPDEWLPDLEAILADRSGHLNLNEHPGDCTYPGDGIKVLFVDNIAGVEVDP